MGLEVSFETNIRNKQITIKMFSDNNAILIGKNGQTLSALTLLCKQAIYSQLGIYVYINLDVENYKDKQIAHLERLAKNIAREVRQTQTPVVMDNMNSYERRVVHNILTNFKGVKTESEGEEPNRHIIVKPARSKLLLFSENVLCYNTVRGEDYGFNYLCYLNCLRCWCHKYN